MSVQAALDFLAKVQVDPALQEQIRNTLTPGDRESNRTQLAQIASDAGFSFTVGDYGSALNEIKKSGKGGELSDADLESVSGGRKASFSVSSGLLSSGGLLSQGGLLTSWKGLADYG